MTTELLSRIDPDAPSPEPVALLGLVGSAEAIPTLRSLLDRAQGGLLACVLEALGRLGDASIAQRLVGHALDDDEDINVRGTACVEIGRLKLPNAEATLAAVETMERSVTRPSPAESILLDGPGGPPPEGAVVEALSDPGDVRKAFLLDCVARGRELLES